MLGNLLFEIEQTKKLYSEIKDIPFVSLNSKIISELESCLKQKYETVSITPQTSYVKTSEGLFSVFSNQYFYLAKICKNLAVTALKYFDFLDINIRDNKEYRIVINELQDSVQDKKDISTPEGAEAFLVKKIPNYSDIISALDADEKKSMLAFLSTNLDLYNNNTKKEFIKKFGSGNSFRSSTDLFGGFILKIIPVENVSSSMLGALIYILVKNEKVYQDLCDNVEIIEESNVNIYSNFEKETYSSEELSAILKDNYKNAEKGGMVAAIHLFGIRFGKIIKDNNYSASKIINDAEMDASYSTELTKGIKLYDCIESGKYGLSFKMNDTETNKNSSKNNIEIKIIKTFKFSSYRISNVFSEKYINSLLSKPFTILAGNSGTGKTKIAKDLATWLGKKDENTDTIANKLIVPVGSDWTDNTKILGFYNPLKKTYESTKILDFIILVRDYPEIPFFLILDEMNLSHVERYFSDFLSAMESHEKIILYSKDEDCDSDIPESIDLPENLFVTGTVNIDETTYMFSPKVLDRANVIEFIPAQSDVLANFADETQPDEITPVNDGSAEGFLALAKSVRETTTLPKDSDVCKTILEGISNILDGSGFEFAFRTAKEIRLYINAAYALAQNEGKTLSEEDYVNLMDEQLLQKILPKVHGNRSQVGTLLSNLSKYSEEKNLKESKKKIARMLNQLETSQFTSFI